MARVDRRGLLGGFGFSLAALLGTARLRGQPQVREQFETLQLWPGSPPGGSHKSVIEQEVRRSETGPANDTAFLHVARPTLTMCRPERPNGAAILLIPGGGYTRVSIGIGGRALMQSFADAGYAAYLLKYRLPGDPWTAGPDAPLQDAQRALRLIRSRAATDGFDRSRIALWGGSAGGHLAARLSNSTHATYALTDSVDAQPLGVSAAMLLYPVNLMDGAHVHAPSRQQLLAHAAPAARLPEGADRLAAQADIGRHTPPTFLAHALDDRVVPVENSLSYFTALRQHGIASELHVQESGGHGFGWARTDGRAWDWPAMALNFIRRHGV